MAEDVIKRIKLIQNSTMRSTGCSPILWYYGMKHDTELFSWIALKGGISPLENLPFQPIASQPIGKVP